MSSYRHSAGGSIVGPLAILGRAVLAGHGGLGVCAEDVAVAVDLAVVRAAGVGNGVRAGQGLKVKEVLEHFCSQEKDNLLHFFLSRNIVSHIEKNIVFCATHCAIALPNLINRTSLHPESSSPVCLTQPACGLYIKSDHRKSSLRLIGSDFPSFGKMNAQPRLCRIVEGRREQSKSSHTPRRPAS